MYDYQGRNTRRELKKEQKRLEKLASQPKRATGKARRCIHCGKWIQLRQLWYLGEDMGKAYIHVNCSPQFIDNIDHAAEPRPLPQRKGGG